MDEREYMVKAQEAEAIAAAAANPRLRSRWEAIAEEYRKLVRAEAELRQILRGK
jgi:hypothetical protein